MSNSGPQIYKIKDRPVMGRNSFHPPYKASDTLINEARIIHVVKGSSTLFAANQVIELQSGDTIVMKSDNFVNNWHSNDDHGLNQIIGFNLYADQLIDLYDKKIPAWLETTDSNEVKPILHIQDHALLNGFFDGLQAYFDHPQLIDAELIQVKIREIISLLAKTDADESIPPIFYSLFKAGDYEFQEIVQAHLFDQLNLEDLAFLANLSLSSFKRKFRAVYGTSPTKYMVSKRLEKSQQLLKTTDMLISHIAYECGFSDVSYFSRTFTKYYHMSPTEFKDSILD